MADKRLTQSPRALRDSTNDPEAFAKGEVQTGMSNPKKSGGPENENAWDLADFTSPEDRSYEF